MRGNRIRLWLCPGRPSGSTSTSLDDDGCVRLGHSRGWRNNALARCSLGPSESEQGPLARQQAPEVREALAKGLRRRRFGVWPVGFMSRCHRPVDEAQIFRLVGRGAGKIRRHRSNLTSIQGRRERCRAGTGAGVDSATRSRGPCCLAKAHERSPVDRIASPSVQLRVASFQMDASLTSARGRRNATA
jgi:hypothetical protein